MEKTVLVVDDIAANRNLLRETLEPEGYEVLLAGDGSTALKVAGRAKPHVILLDVNMPDMDGYTVCQHLKADDATAEIPVIFITANDDAQSLVKGFQAGGVDFVGKPFKGEEVLMRVSTHLRLYTLTQSLAKQNEVLGQEVQLRKVAEEKANDANEAKSRFLSFMSHEMRAPLNAIIGFSEELVDALEGEEHAQDREDAARIRSGGEHLLGLINNLLDLSKIEAGKMPVLMEDCMPADVVDQLSKDVAPLIRKNNNVIKVECAPDVGTFQTDVTKLRQVLTNLISNAAKFTKEGEITLTVRVTEKELSPAGRDPDTSGPRVRERVEASELSSESERVEAEQQLSPTKRDRQYLCFSVKDTGIGMSKLEMARLFQAYQQANDDTNKQFGGTGLGLAISREFCRLLGGDLTVESAPGKGAVFTATVPVN